MTEKKCFSLFIKPLWSEIKKIGHAFVNCFSLYTAVDSTSRDLPKRVFLSFSLSFFLYILFFYLKNISISLYQGLMALLSHNLVS